MTIDGIDIDVQYKNVRGIRMVVYPDKRVRISAPFLISEKAIQDFVESRIHWLHRTLHKMEERNKKKEDEPSPDLTPLQQLVEEQKQYQQLMTYLKPQFDYWRTKMGLPPANFNIRKMHTRWGSCTPAKRTIRFNLLLAKQPHRNIDYIIVHELAHLRYANHGTQFKQLLSQFMPDWRERQKELKQTVL